MAEPEQEPATPSGPSWARRLAVTAILLVLLGTFAVTLLSYLARRHWFLDDLTSFTVQYAVAAGVCMVALILLKVRRWPLLGSIALAICLVRLMSPATNTTGPHGPPLRLVSANVKLTNAEFDRFLAFVRKADPDVLLVLEVTPRWAAALEGLRDEWPHTVVVSSNGAFGIALFSRVPFDSHEIAVADRTGFPSIIATITHDGEPLTVIGTHPPPPNFTAAAANRNHQFGELAKLARGAQGDVVLMGDLNVSPWSPHFHDLLDGSGLSDSRAGFGIQPTWPTFCPPLMTPIDHALVSRRLAVVERRVGPDVGSDHRPIVVEVARRR